MTRLSFQESLDKMIEIMNIEDLTIDDYNEFMSIPISDTFSSEEQRQMSWMRESMNIMSGDIIARTGKNDFVRYD
tara:strand:- start:1092 stop:1316 length:225 start_codon:yes stop_codon:yes gene_type:complete